MEDTNEKFMMKYLDIFKKTKKDKVSLKFLAEYLLGELDLIETEFSKKGNIIISTYDKIIGLKINDLSLVKAIKNMDDYVLVKWEPDKWNTGDLCGRECAYKLEYIKFILKVAKQFKQNLRIKVEHNLLMVAPEDNRFELIIAPYLIKEDENDKKEN